MRVFIVCFKMAVCLSFLVFEKMLGFPKSGTTFTPKTNLQKTNTLLIQKNKTNHEKIK